jgi:hypothetical protein
LVLSAGLAFLYHVSPPGGFSFILKMLAYCGLLTLAVCTTWGLFDAAEPRWGDGAEPEDEARRDEMMARMMHAGQRNAKAKTYQEWKEGQERN